MRRICDADEIHIFDATREFELGMVCFFSVEALHHRRIKIFDDRIWHGSARLSGITRLLFSVKDVVPGTEKIVPGTKNKFAS